MATGIPSNNGKRNIKGFSLTYEGKTNPIEVLNGPRAELACVFENQTESTNRLIYGDNLPVLRTMLDDKAFRNKVRLIYIDPPFATGADFESRTQEKAYSDQLQGADYLEFLRQRLIVLKELLAEDGSIYVHLDSNMAFATKLLMDEIFGAENFRNWITRRKTNPKNYTSKTYGNISDYILFYSKSKNYVWNKQTHPLPSEFADSEYRHIDERTGRRYMRVPVHAPGVRKGATGKTWKGMQPPPGKHWQYLPSKLDEMDSKGHIYWSKNGNPRRKIYLDEHKGVGLQDIWWDFKDAHNQNVKITGYPTEKNPELIKRILLGSSNEGDIVLDAFMGSGTVAEVASLANRKWIGIDNSFEAIKTTVRRLTHGTERMGDYVKKENGSQQMKFELPKKTKVAFSLYSHEQDRLVEAIGLRLEAWQNDIYLTQ
jgi:adenine-specific DNA-methyltransferase